ncbi:MAG: MFS transporter [Cyanobacteria bacterium SIG32]|nr:MFS transporter [Cyanobacteria bacterium SIG32]
MSIDDEKLPRIWLSGAHFINDVYTGFLNPIMPFIAAKLGITMAIATVILSMSHIFSSLMQPIFGFFADNILKRAFIFWGLILTSIFIPLAPASSSIYYMVIFIILGSLGSSLFHPQALGLANKFSGSDVAKHMGIFIAMGTLGYSVGPFLSASVTQFCGLDKMPMLSVLGVFWAIIMFKFVPKMSNVVSNKKHINLKHAFKDILSNRKLNILNVISMLKSLISTSCFIFLPFLWKDMGYSAFFIGMALFVFIFVGGIGSLLSNKFEKLVGTQNVFYFSMISTLPLMLIFVLTYKTFPIFSFFVYFVMGFVTMLAVPVTMNIAQSVLPQYKSIIGGFINGFSWGIVALIMSMNGFLAQNFGITKVLLVVSFIPAIFSIIFVRYLFKDLSPKI